MLRLPERPKFEGRYTRIEDILYWTLYNPLHAPHPINARVTTQLPHKMLPTGRSSESSDYKCSEHHCQSPGDTKHHPLYVPSSPTPSILATRARRSARSSSRLQRAKHPTLYIRRSY
jgi:hypothetical protein